MSRRPSPQARARRFRPQGEGEGFDLERREVLSATWSQAGVRTELRDDATPRRQERPIVPSESRVQANARAVEDVAVTRGIVYRINPFGAEQRLDVYTPTDTNRNPDAQRPIIVAIHGGGWRRYNKNDFGPDITWLAKAGYIVVVPNYTLSVPGQGSWPINFEDVREAVRWTRTHAPTFGGDPDRIAALGVSAGGHLAELLATDLVDPSAETVSSRVRAAISFGGPTDLSTLSADSREGAGSAVAQMLGAPPKNRPDRAREASPIAHIGPDTAPMLLIHGTADALVPVSQALKMTKALAAANVPHQLVFAHGADHKASLRTQAQARSVLAFLRATLR